MKERKHLEVIPAIQIHEARQTVGPIMTLLSLKELEKA